MYDQIKLRIPSGKVKSYPGSTTLFFKTWKWDFPTEYFPSVPQKFDPYIDSYLEVQFSASKIRCQNNLLETTPELLIDPSVECLAEQLDKMEIEVPLDTLRNASNVYGVEICKGINTDVMPSRISVDHFSKFPAPRGYMDPAEDYYRSQPKPGQCRFFGKMHEVTFYDKTKDLLDKPQDNIKEFERRIPNILRWEVRLHGKALQYFFKVDEEGKKKRLITLSDLVDKIDFYEEVIKKYWKPFVKASKYIPIYASPEVQLEQIKAYLSPDEYKALLLFKFLEDSQGYIYATECFKQNFEEDLAKVKYLYRKYPLMDVVAPKYQIMDKLDQAISQPHWWITMADVFQPNEHPFEFSNYLVEDFWTIKDSADYLGVCERVVQKKCKDGEIPSRMIHKQYRLRKGDVMNYLYQHRKTAKGPETI